MLFEKPHLENTYFQLLYCIKGHDTAINSIIIIKAELPDPKKDENSKLNLIATAGEDHLINLWTETGQKIGTFGSGIPWNLRNKGFLPNKNQKEDNKFDINFIEKENIRKGNEIDEKLKMLNISKNTIDNEKENEDDKVTTLYNTFKLLRIR